MYRQNILTHEELIPEKRKDSFDRGQNVAVAERRTSQSNEKETYAAEKALRNLLLENPRQKWDWM